MRNHNPSLNACIPGMPRFRHEEFCDDKEIGGGRMILNMIKRSQLSNIAIFVVRLHKSVNVGLKRFEMIQDAVLNVMSQQPYNKFTNSKQNMDLYITTNRKVETTNQRGVGWHKF